MSVVEYLLVWVLPYYYYCYYYFFIIFIVPYFIKEGTNSSRTWLSTIPLRWMGKRIYSFMTWNWIERSASHTGCLISKEIASSMDWMGDYMGPRIDLDSVEKLDFSLPLSGTILWFLSLLLYLLAELSWFK